MYRPVPITAEAGLGEHSNSYITLAVTATLLHKPNFQIFPRSRPYRYQVEHQ
jgi:hypothetical protein